MLRTLESRKKGYDWHNCFSISVLCLVLFSSWFILVSGKQGWSFGCLRFESLELVAFCYLPVVGSKMKRKRRGTYKKSWRYLPLLRTRILVGSYFRLHVTWSKVGNRGAATFWSRCRYDTYLQGCMFYYRLHLSKTIESCLQKVGNMYSPIWLRTCAFLANVLVGGPWDIQWRFTFSEKEVAFWEIGVHMSEPS